MVENKQEATTNFNSTISKIPQVAIEKTLPVKKLTLSNMPEIKFSTITRNSIPDRFSDFVVIDLETTGLQAGTCEIIEVSAIKYDNFQPVSCFTTLLKSRKPLPDNIKELTGITDDMLIDSPCFAEIATALNDFIGKSNLVGHNLIFDLKFLYKNGYDFTLEKRKYFDTLELAKKKLKKFREVYKNGEFDDIKGDIENYKLDTVCEYYDIRRDNSHRSLSDCFATGLIYEAIINDITNTDVNSESILNNVTSKEVLEFEKSGCCGCFGSVLMVIITIILLSIILLIM